MSGLLALLDDVAALTKLAAAQLDDVAGQAAKVGVKAAGVVIDDTAVTPKYVHGLPAARELPIVLKIARGSLFNKLVILLPVALLLNAFAPWLLGPLLILGGCYLCFEGAEKVWHVFHGEPDALEDAPQLDGMHLEQQRVSGAIKTDFILSAEIMTIALAAIESDSIWIEGAILAFVAIGITVLVYGSVAALVKVDDLGLKMAQDGRLKLTRYLGRGMVRGMPGFMSIISGVGTAAMLWVGGSIIIHGLEGLKFGWLAHTVEQLSAAASNIVSVAPGFSAWATEAVMGGVFGLITGFAILILISFSSSIFQRNGEPS